MLTEVVTRKYQVTIPKEVREALGIRVGDRLLVRVVDGRIVLEPISRYRALEKLSTIADRLLGELTRLNLLKKLLEGKQLYIDTNVFIYVALKHPDFYRECYSVLEMLVSGEI